jgi:hypothetical protein
VRNAVGMGLVCDTKTTICAKAFSTHIRMTVSAPNVLAVGVFGIGIFH